MVKYEITYEVTKDKFFPGIHYVCKYDVYQDNELNELAVIAYNDYRLVLSLLRKGKETIIYLDKHPSPHISLWVKRNGLCINREPIYTELYN